MVLAAARHVLNLARQWLAPLDPQWRICMQVESADEVPEHLPTRGAVLVGSVTRPKWLAFDCPCAKKHRILVNLDSGRYPYWVVSKRPDLTLRPSVDYKGSDGRCHYLIRKGRVIWVKEGTGHDRFVYRRSRK